MSIITIEQVNVACFYGIAKFTFIAARQFVEPLLQVHGIGGLASSFYQLNLLNGRRALPAVDLESGHIVLTIIRTPAS
ncbi:MAG: hypothetical protein GWN92_23195 [candidate division Zixibacteria bacterium]|nr:hypothetical protein [candidate division Zixibacteria bacterium]